MNPSSDSFSAAIALGSNLGDREAWLDLALAAIDHLPETRIAHRSSRLDNPAQEMDGAPPNFLNQVVLVDTGLCPQTLLGACLGIEAALGRTREGAEPTSRTIDLDLIYYEDQIIQTETLSLPHPAMHTRYFVLGPLAEIAPDWEHPTQHRSVAALLEILHQEFQP